jgi:hypothetical protein
MILDIVPEILSATLIALICLFTLGFMIVQIHNVYDYCFRRNKRKID